MKSSPSPKLNTEVSVSPRPVNSTGSGVEVGSGSGVEVGADVGLASGTETTSVAGAAPCWDVEGAAPLQATTAKITMGNTHTKCHLYMLYHLMGYGGIVLME